VSARFVRFCVAGTGGFVVDAGLLQALVDLAGADPFIARVGSFLAAATFTWWVNRHYTFGVGHAPTRGEWLRYVTAMTLGAAVNYAVFAATLLAAPLAMRQPWLGVAAGSAAGLAVNYGASRRYVFRR
jgi:putative flippase GtrA